MAMEKQSKLRSEMNLQNFINEKFRKQFHLFNCIFHDYVGHEILKELWKTAILKIRELISLDSVKTALK